MGKYNILVIGSGGREHAIVKSLRRSDQVADIYVAPGNAGINCEALPAKIAASNLSALVDFCKNNNIDYVIVGPEQPLVDGIVDYLEDKNIKVFGTNRAASRIEGSKQFMKNVVAKYGIATAKFQNFSNAEEAKKYIQEENSFPIVIKTDGLASGKGVIIAHNIAAAFNAVDIMFAGQFGDAGKKIVVEEFLEGREVSFFALCDGEKGVYIGSAQDHKRAFDNDEGPNTGGMGTFSPTHVVDNDLQERVTKEIINPLIQGLKNDGITYKGILFAGLMIDENNNPKLLEYNVRFGDPEAQVILPRLKTDFFSLIKSVCDGEKIEEVSFYDKSAVCVIFAAKGYPGKYKKGSLIKNVLDKKDSENVIIYHAGTSLDENGKLIANGGRVLGVTGIADNIEKARAYAYQEIDEIDWQDGFFRKDIGV